MVVNRTIRRIPNVSKLYSKDSMSFIWYRKVKNTFLYHSRKSLKVISPRGDFLGKNQHENYIKNT